MRSTIRRNAFSIRRSVTSIDRNMLQQKYSVTVEEYGITFETGTLAKQANGAATIRLGETMVFIAATAAENIQPGQDFFPLTVD